MAALQKKSKDKKILTSNKTILNYFMRQKNNKVFFNLIYNNF